MAVPTEMVMDGNVLPLYTFEQLDLDRKKARSCATTLRDKLGGFANHIPPLKLTGSTDGVILWLLHAQCAVCSYAGFRLTPQSFGAPPGYGEIKGQGAVVSGPGYGQQRTGEQWQQAAHDYTGLATPFATGY